MSRFILGTMIATLFGCGVVGSGQVYAQRGYPLVYGPTGNPYGPTQAHYQYQRQYGHAWQGDGVTPPAAALNPNGVSIGFAHVYAPYHWGPFAPYGLGIGGYYPGFPEPGYGFGGYGYGVYGAGYGFPPYVMATGGYLGVQPPGINVSPGVVNAQPAPLNPNQQITTPGGKFWQKNQPVAVTPEQQAEAAQWIARGDEQVRARQYPQGLQSYQRAAQLAGDQAQPHMRLCIAWTTLRNYREAVGELKKALALDESLPASARSPFEIFGPNQKQTVDFVLQSTAQWAREDLRDPDRLFLIGALLQLNGDPERAAIPLQSAARLTQEASYVMAFVSANQHRIQQVGNKASALPSPPKLMEDQPANEPEIQQVPRRLPQKPQGIPQKIQDDNAPMPVPKREPKPTPDSQKKPADASPPPTPAPALAPTPAQAEEKKEEEQGSGPILPNPSGN